MKNIFKLSVLLVGLVCQGQVSMNFGTTELIGEETQNTITWSVGYTHMISQFGIKGNFRDAGFSGVRYRSVDLMGIHRTEIGSYRLDLGAGASWNDLNNKTNPIATVKNAIKIDPDIYVTLDIEGVFRESLVAHFLVGFTVDVSWKTGKRKPKRFF